ncbi:hypothetical protein, partial [Acetobacter papayae]|uniref:hypothetical protein n=1 Tax=Acetobacter papayae TaxID=1076592 RepID=UPI001F4676C3
MELDEDLRDTSVNRSFQLCTSALQASTPWVLLRTMCVVGRDIEMINNLSVATSANFYSIRKNLSDKTVQDLFVTLRASHGVTANNEFKHTREQLDGARWSAVCFRYESPPSFLKDTTKIRESLCGFILLR